MHYKIEAQKNTPGISQPNILGGMEENAKEMFVSRVLNHGLCPFRTHGLVKEKGDCK
jgi:hypothetical protein